MLAAALAGVLTAGGVTVLAQASDETEAGGAAGAAAERSPGGLGRGLVSVGGDQGNLVSWRSLAADPEDVAFHLYRDGTRITEEPLSGTTNYLDEGAPSDASYSLATVTDGVEAMAAEEALAMPRAQTDIPLDRPSNGHHPNDASVGDLDGDGDLDLVLKWEPDNAKDNSQSGVTDNVYLDGVTLDGERLWRIDLGPNIRAGAHYTQFQVYDYDGDGAAEVAVKTADGTVDGEGTVIGDAGADHRNSGGYVLEGPEFLTVFHGATGAAVDTVDYVPPRGNVADWGDDYGNRVDRFLAGTAHLGGDGQNPSLVMARGYYTRSTLAAWDFDGQSLSQRWFFDSDEAGGQYAGQGSHSLSVGDVDLDGNDEIVYGAMAVDDDGSPMWSTGTGHGDAQHLGDFDPTSEGLEYFKVSESTSQPSSLLIDPANGEIQWETDAGADNGRGVAGDIWADNPGAEFWSSSVSGLRNLAGEEIGPKPSSANFLVWWDGDATRELLDGTHIDKYSPDGDERLLTAEGVSSNNGTKSTPVLSADILGDWREEVIWRTSDNNALRIYSTDIPTDLTFPSLMEDRQYRTGVAWQNTAYNQPPHPSFALDAAAAEAGTGVSARSGAAPSAVDWPEATEEIEVNETIEVDGDFDGGNARYVPGPGLGDGGQGEDQLPVFEVAEGGSLNDVIIGSPGADGVHCEGSCALNRVWWEDVGEDAATFRGGDGSTFTVSGGAARGADDKVFQHNGGGELTVTDFAAEDFTTLYRSCGNCSSQYQRSVVLDGVEVTAPASRLVGINENYDDTATLRAITVIGDDGDLVPCQRYVGNDSGDEPEESGEGPDGTHCRYSESDISYQ
ncbi:rhamnogalacturonan lyase [Streptomyces triticirhizae]|uniref:pectate lyase n=1 Tax=Streptomyces triticirhizae TaxID=2483353 RepID=A0A3M2LP13_9ACTN|nr:rhamnogalacturonan lyase [Streptomyces triticirhizae]